MAVATSCFKLASCSSRHCRLPTLRLRSQPGRPTQHAASGAEHRCHRPLLRPGGTQSLGQLAAKQRSACFMPLVLLTVPYVTSVGIEKADLLERGGLQALVQSHFVHTSLWRRSHRTTVAHRGPGPGLLCTRNYNSSDFFTFLHFVGFFHPFFTLPRCPPLGS